MRNLYNVIRKLSLIFILLFGVFANAQFLTTSGKQILDKNGDSIILRGVGLGGWMLQEPYMMNFVGGADNQQQFRSKLESLIGETNTQEFYNKWLDNFVTKTDKYVEKVLIEELSKIKKNYSFITEETGIIKNNDKENFWIIDPIDGTTNFLHGIPHFAISIALMSKEELLSGLIFDPIKDEMFFAEKDKGAFLNNQRLRVSKKNSLDALSAHY